MFYSQFILAKKGPLGTIWIAAHLERKLRKNQVADTDIGVSVDSILSPDVPIALRMTSHLLLGVVRIYNRKVNYLFDDCSEALLKIKQAFRSAAVDLPPEESKAPYHSITLPEKFDLDDFELPDSDIFQGNYVDHHISSREQITLQDSMEGVSYSTSKFGLDERFGDGDMSGLDLEEELFLQKIGDMEHADERADPQASFGSTSTLKQDQHPEDRAADSEAIVDGGERCTDTMDYAQAPGTPGLVEEPNFSKVQEASACDDHLESEYNLTGSTVREDTNRAPYEEKQEVDSQNDTIPDSLPQGQPEENGHLSGQIESLKLTSECTKEIMKESDVPDHTEAIKVKNMNDLVSVEDQHNDHDSDVVGLEVSKGASAKDVSALDVEVPSAIVDTNNEQKSRDVEDQNGLILGDAINSSGLNLDTHDGEAATETIVLRPCNSDQGHADVAKPAFGQSNDEVIKSDIYVEATDGEETAKLGEVQCVNDNSENNVKENQAQHHASDKDIVVGHFTAELPAPEQLLSVPEGHMDLHSGVMEVSPGDFEGLDEDDAGSKTAAGRKRTFTESTLTEQSLNSAESSRQVRPKQMSGSVPDDDDLLSSILVGRNSSMLRVKPTPPPYEVTSIKRSRVAPRSGAPKRKVLMDDTMVLHGDAIRQQLTNSADIRRVRKKAPCTLSEISMIRKQHMEDETFLDPIFTGMSVELISLHGQVYDLGRIKICQKEVNDASLAQNSENVNESAVLPNTRSEKSDTYLETMVEFYSTSPNRRSDMEEDKGTGKTIATDITGDVLNDDFLTVRDNDTAEPCENHVPTESKVEEVDCTSIEVDEEQKPTTYEGTYDSQIEHMMSAPSVDEPEEIINARVDRDTDVVLDQSKNVPSADLDFADVNHEQAIGVEGKEDGNVCESEIEVGSKYYILPDMAQDAAAEVILDAADDGGLEYHLQSAIHSTTSKDQIDVESSYPGLESMMQGGPMNDYENLDHTDAYPFDMMGGETSGFDTEFLNVDDDDLNEMADDSLPDAEDAQYSENTGWSSRTRAVSKYLQAAFVKEADCGRSCLSLENLLVGKSRKEASRMFFETLVLKTRDYIHVEQKNPFGDTTIRPRTRLMKSDF